MPYLLRCASRLCLAACLLTCAASGSAQTSVFRRDFEDYWQTIKDHFAYFDIRKTDWEKVRTIYAPAADTIRSRVSLVHLLERVNHELYNGHVQLNTNTSSSSRVIPSGADLKVIWEQGRFQIAEVRQRSAAARCGLKPGMTVVAYNNIPVAEAIRSFLPQSAGSYDKEMYGYAATTLFAGTHNTTREITALVQGVPRQFKPDDHEVLLKDTTLLQAEVLPGNIGYIRIHNSLGNQNLIPAFDRALDSLMRCAGLILDLRETPGGGNTTVARGIMGRFIVQELPYQKHIYVNEEKETGIRRSTLELVSPRGRRYKAPVIVLVGYWTGSMGEGIAIGFDALKRARVAGTPMAGLLGEIFTFETPVAKIPFSFPCVQLQHVDGRPREAYEPPIRITDQEQAIPAAIRLLTGKP